MNFRTACNTKFVIKFINHVLIASQTVEIVCLMDSHVSDECVLIRSNHLTNASLRIVQAVTSVVLIVSHTDLIVSQMTFQAVDQSPFKIAIPTAITPRIKSIAILMTPLMISHAD